MYRVFAISLALSLAAAAGPATAQTVPPVAEAKQRIVAPPKPTPATPPRMSHLQLTEKVNQNTVTIISGNPNGGFLGMAYDISAVLDNGDEMRILPIVGKGGAQNVRDLLYLKGIDMGITQSNTMTYFKKTGEFPNIENRLFYITTLFQDEMHIVAVPGIATIKDLNGKRVNFSDAGSGTQLTVKLVFEALGIKAEEVNMGQADALEKMKKGELDATVCVCSKPLKPFREMKEPGGFKLVTVPFEDKILADYAPITLSHEDYPNLIPQGEKVDTIALTSVLAAYNWQKDTDRYRKVAQFIEAFFPKLAEFHKAPRNPKWKSVNLNASLPGWKRFPAAQGWIEKAMQQAKTEAATTTASTSSAAAAIDPELAKQQAARVAPANPIEQERLFQKFMEWAKSQPPPQ